MADQDQERMERERLQGGMGQQDAAAQPSASQASGGGSGQQSGGPQPSAVTTDKVGEQIGQNQQSYGSSTQQDSSGGQGPQQVNLGAQGQTGHLGPAPGAGVGQSKSATTGGADLSKGLSDQNQGGGGV